ncbi:MAG: RecX family transcriptional regulator [Dehalococcoidales bacterium]|nr:RecX family transcriptional regulator [Dehalococcoidales bacterium]
MNKITALSIGKGKNKRVNVFLDNRFAFSLEAEVALKESLQIGQQLSGEQIKILTKADQYYRCLNAATNYLSYRPRSELELRKRLQQRGFNDISIETTINKLKEQGLVDDQAFAQFWKENRDLFNQRSQWLIKMELKQKGIADYIIEQVTDTIDDEDSAYRAAQNKCRSLPLFDYQNFRRRLGEYLKRRGFSYIVINKTIEQLWEEKTTSKTLS